MKTLIVLSAIPGSGKSTWAKQYISEHPGTLIISSDEIRKEITGSYEIFDRQAEVWATFDKRIHEYANTSDDVTVILDALNDINSLRIRYKESTPEYDRHILVLVKTSFETAIEWNNRREGGKKLPLEIMKKLRDKWEEPTQEVLSMYDEVIEVINK